MLLPAPLVPPRPRLLPSAAMIGETVSHYRILEKLGEGGMGAVYKAEDTKLQRIVAIKFLSRTLGKFGPDERFRFQQEARAASLLDHPNIETIHEIDESGEHVFIVMGYVDGTNLLDKLRRTKMKITDVLDFAIQTAEGLAAAHEKGIVHRDIKSANLMVTSRGQVKIVDFGLAKLKSSGKITQTGGTVGTLAYMSPEQLKGGEIDHRADIWSFGVVFYEMLTGEVPFKADTPSAIIYPILNESPAAPSALDRRIPPPVDSIVAKLLEKDRGRRYQEMSDVARDLRAVHDEIAAAATAAKTKAIAVLPFANISPDRESDYFGDGLTEELIANLSRLKDVRVVSRTTSMQYKGTQKDIKTIGRELGVRYLVEGSVRKFQDNLRITAQLVDVETDAQLWAETYKGKLADVFDIQEQVSKQIVDALMVKLTPTEKVVLTKRATLNAEAFDLNLRARGFLYRPSKTSMQYAIQLFQKAIELDPRYAGAYAGLGETYAMLYQYFDRKAIWLDKAIESALKALMYDASLSEAYAALGLAYFHKKAYEDALASAQKAIELDPNNVGGYWILARISLVSDREREAIALLQKVIGLDPNFYAAFGILRMAHERLGEKHKAEETLPASLAAFTRYLTLHPEDANAHVLHAAELASAGRSDEARAAAACALKLSPDDPLMLYNGACTFACLGDRKMALEALTRAVDAGFEFAEWIRRDPDLASLRDEPEFKALVDRLTA